MKNLTYLLIASLFAVICLISCNSETSHKVRFHGKITIPKERLNDKGLIYVKAWPEKTTLDSIKLNADGSFDKTVSFDKIESVALIYSHDDRGTFPFITLNGRDYEFVNTPDTVYHNGNPEWKYERKEAYIRQGGVIKKYFKKHELPCKEFTAYMKEFHSKATETFENYVTANPEVEKNWVEKTRIVNDLKYKADLLRYTFTNMYWKGGTSLNTCPVIEQEINAFINEVDYNDEKLLTYGFYKTYLGFCIDYLAFKRVLSGESSSYPIAKLELINEKITDTKEKESRINKSLKELTKLKAQDFDAYEKLYLAGVQSPDLIENMKKEVDNARKVATGVQAPDFTFEDINGKQVSLSDFKGKAVYIDFWATWCGPCKKEIPHLKELEKKYHGKEIVFISVSTDKEKDKDTWQKMVNDMGMTGVQLFTGDMGPEIRSKYVVKYIPHFTLIDKEGKIVKNNCERPSGNEKIWALIDKTVL